MKRKEQICRFCERTARRKHNSEYEVSTTFFKAVNCVDTIDNFTSVHVSIPSGMQ